jgi:hypothetical protein
LSELELGAILALPMHGSDGCFVAQVAELGTCGGNGFDGTCDIYAAVRQRQLMQ